MLWIHFITKTVVAERKGIDFLLPVVKCTYIYAYICLCICTCMYMYICNFYLFLYFLFLACYNIIFHSFLRFSSVFPIIHYV